MAGNVEGLAKYVRPTYDVLFDALLRETHLD